MNFLSFYVTGFWSIGLALSLLSSNNSPGFTPKYLHIAGLFPMSPRDSPEGKLGLGVIPAVELALEHVNSHSGILPGIKLNLTWSDTKVSPASCNSASNSMYSIHEVYSGAACTQLGYIMSWLMLEVNEVLTCSQKIFYIGRRSNRMD